MSNIGSSIEKNIGSSAGSNIGISVVSDIGSNIGSNIGSSIERKHPLFIIGNRGGGGKKSPDQ